MLFYRIFLLSFVLGVLGCAASGDTPTGGGECTVAGDCVDDGVFCNGTPVCNAGRCEAGPPPSCDDNIACTVDTCLASADECQQTPDDTRCPEATVCQIGMGCVRPVACEFDTDCAGDGMFCNGEEVCLDSMCVSPGMNRCDDGDSCTVDECVESSSSCANMAADYLNDPMACGPTGQNDCMVCPMPAAAQVNMTASCTDGACGLECDPGFFDSDGNEANGCECMSGMATDDPDDGFMDSNCDGVDGDLSRAIVVSVSMGNDTPTCGLDLATPCRTIAHATARAIGESRRDLFLMAGVYQEIVTLRDGIRMFGGFDVNWNRGPRTDTAHRTVLRGDFDAVEGQYLTVVGRNLVVAATLENLILEGPDAAMPGLSSHVVHLDSSEVTILRSTLQQGNGAAGAAGSAGLDAPVVVATSGMGGGMGGMADAYITTCDSFTFGAAGTAGTNSCAGGPSTTSPAGGAGGGGGVMDNTCVCLGFCVCDGGQCVAAGGQNGGSADQSIAGGFGFRGEGGAGATTCGIGTGGFFGRVVNGGRGTGAIAFRGSVTGGYWQGRAGGAGLTGENGGGGGGGGGSGGCDNGFLPGDNSHGAGGGGGGAGGCAARSGGGGGNPGGGSFGIFAINSTVTLTGVEFQRGIGGDGGNGGVGGQGQSGGSGGSGGTATGTSARVGGDGAPGGHGGHGGGGGGGSGGIAYGVFSLNSTVNATGAVYAGGAAGTGGSGGASAPGAPAGEADGNPGTPGVAGNVGEVFTCAAAGAC
ncbi:MAG: hypothetical protein AAGF12_11655 [Myxococcota bacterium]